jgi:2-polyprenyl-6-methoxyphenol hydroxylase-like FAD-dependent oxidoreductase
MLHNKQHIFNYPGNDGPRRHLPTIIYQVNQTRDWLRMTDIAVIGAGLAGSIVATVLARSGFSVTLVDRASTQPRRFRAEQLVGEQVELLAQLDVLEQIVAEVEPIDHAVGLRRGHIAGGENGRHYGIPYHELVRRARNTVPPQVRSLEGRLDSIETGPDRQKIILGTGHPLNARLVILATGSQASAVHAVGLQRHIIRRAHSLTFGFDIEPAYVNSIRIPLLTCYPDHVGHRVDYMTVFPIGNIWRANMFTYHDLDDAWIQRLRSNPHATVCSTFPRIQTHFGAFRVASSVQMHVTDLYTSVNPSRCGVVLIGDSFQSSCPATGTGIGRLLMDVNRLCNVHLPRWLATPGMDSAKIAAFYNDPVKRQADHAALELAEYQRSVATETSWKWVVHRAQLGLRKRFGSIFGGPRSLTTGVTRARIPRWAPDQAQPGRNRTDLGSCPDAFSPPTHWLQGQRN